MPETTVPLPNWTPQRTQQVDFSGALNAGGAPHLIGPNEVQTSTNVDFSLEWGGAPARRGNVTYAWEASHGVSAINIQMIGRNYTLSTGTWLDASIPWFAGADSGVTYSGTGTNTIAPVALTSVAGYAGGAQSQVFPVMTQYGSSVYVANGTSAFRQSGTAIFDWILPQADTPTVTFFQQGTFSNGVFIGLSGTFTTPAEGTVTGSSTSSYFSNASVPNVILTTATTGGSRIVFVGAPVLFNWENPNVFVTLPTGGAVTSTAGTYTFGGDIDFHTGWPNGDTSGQSGTFTATATITETMTIGAYGTDYILLGLNDQQSIVSIQRDLSIGDSTFTNYWHAETTPQQLQDAVSDPLSLLIAAQGTAVIDSQTAALNLSRATVPAISRRNVPAPLPAFRRTASKTATAGSGNISPWGVARSDYQFVGTLPTPDFTNIQQVRVIIEFNTINKQAVCGGVATYGAVPWSLNDQASGISYYQTFARVENGVIVAEGAPSTPSPPTKAQYAYGKLVCAANTNTTAGITHRVFYRTGGLLQDAYRCGSCSINSGTNVIYDIANPDMQIVSRPKVKRFLWSTWPAISAGTGLPGVNAVSEPWNDRIFVGVQNYLYWSYPGNPAQVNDVSQTTVGDLGDTIYGIIPYGNLIIVKQASVYEMAGNIFEGTGQDWTLQKSGSRRGSAAPKTVIKTPFGIFLFSYDGASFYRAGYGIDQDLSWVYDKIGDAWKGTAATDPAALKGRIPAINHSAIYNSCAAYKDEKIFLAVPTGTNTLADTMFVMDVPRQRIWMHQYPFKINSLFWDRVGNRIMAGTDKGTIQQIEFGLTDDSTTHVPAGITWSWQTRAWSTPTDLIYEDLQVENVGTITSTAIIDRVVQPTTIFTSTAKTWTPNPLSAVIGDNISFVYSGTQSGTQQEVYQMQWNNIPQAPKVTFAETEFQIIPSENYVKTWLAELDTIGTATITALILGAGNVPITLANGATNTLLSGALGRGWFQISPKNPTVTTAVKARYTSTAPFKYYDTAFEFEPKPFEKITWIVTYKKVGGATQADMGRFFAMDIEGTLTATVTSTWIIDGVAFTTNTFTISSANAGEVSGVGRLYADQIPFPPGARGYLFQQQLSSSQPFRVWKAHMDIDRIGVKGLSRVTLSGTPSAQEQQR